MPSKYNILLHLNSYDLTLDMLCSNDSNLGAFSRFLAKENVSFRIINQSDLHRFAALGLTSYLTSTSQRVRSYFSDQLLALSVRDIKHFFTFLQHLTALIDEANAAAVFGSLVVSTDYQIETIDDSIFKIIITINASA